MSRYVRPIERRVEMEQYRMDLVEALVEALVGYRLFMLTAHPERQKAATLGAISRRIPQLNLERAYFDTHDEQQPDGKRRMLRTFMLPEGIDPATCFAIESNPLTRRMYKGIGVAAASSARLVVRLEAVK